MLHDFLPKRKLGMLWPLSIQDNMPYEFYRIAPKDVMLVGEGLGLNEFSAHDVTRVFSQAVKVADGLVGRGIDLIMQSGVPLPILIGLDGHDELLGRLAQSTGKPATSSVQGVGRAAKHLGIRNVALANKWRPDMNATLAKFFARDGVAVAGVSTEVMGPDKFQRMGVEESLDLAYALGRQALIDHPEADGLYIGGGAWIVMPMVEPLEKEFGKPVLCNMNCFIWNALHMVDYWKPIAGQGRLLAGS